MGGRSRSYITRAAALAAVLLCAACREPAPEASEPSVTIVPRGLAVLEHQIPIENAPPGSDTWDLEFTIDSLFYLMHGNEPIVRVFTHDGKAVRTISTTAAAPAALGWKGDSLWVFDAAKSVVSLFASSGVPGRTWNPLPDLMRSRTRFTFIGLQRDGSALVHAQAVPEANADSAPGSALLRVSKSSGIQVDTFARFDPGMAAHIVVSALDDMIWLITEGKPRPDSGLLGVIKLKPTGETVFARQFAYKPIARAGGLLPSVNAVFEAANGSLLIRREAVGGPLALWTVLNRIGVRVAELETPSTADVKVADGTFVYGITRDTRARPAITRYKIERPDTVRRQ
jgi:hypothetical protein